MVEKGEVGWYPGGGRGCEGNQGGGGDVKKGGSDGGHQDEG